MVVALASQHTGHDVETAPEHRLPRGERLACVRVQVIPEVESHLRAWLQTRPGAKNGDAKGRPGSWPRTTKP
jgi:hypothetical protein